MVAGPDHECPFFQWIAGIRWFIFWVPNFQWFSYCALALLSYCCCRRGLNLFPSFLYKPWALPGGVFIYFPLSWISHEPCHASRLDKANPIGLTSKKPTQHHWALMQTSLTDLDHWSTRQVSSRSILMFLLHSNQYEKCWILTQVNWLGRVWECVLSRK